MECDLLLYETTYVSKCKDFPVMTDDYDEVCYAFIIHTNAIVFLQIGLS